MKILETVVVSRFSLVEISGMRPAGAEADPRAAPRHRRSHCHRHAKKEQPKGCSIFGGDKRDRTADLLNAIQALSQLSYTPM